MTLLALLRKLIRALNSEGTPGQVAVGIALGACLGLTPLLSLHNLLLVGVAMVLRVSLPGVFLGWMVFTPLGFLLDPLFDAIGSALLMDAEGLRPFWTDLYNAPVIALSGFNNTIVLGSLVFWVVAALPVFFAARFGVARYRATLYERLQGTKFYKGLKASGLYNLYRILRPR